MKIKYRNLVVKIIYIQKRRKYLTEKVKKKRLESIDIANTGFLKE